MIGSERQIPRRDDPDRCPAQAGLLAALQFGNGIIHVPQPDVGLAPEAFGSLSAKLDHPVVVDPITGLREIGIVARLFIDALRQSWVKDLGADSVGGHVLQTLSGIPTARARVQAGTALHSRK